MQETSTSKAETTLPPERPPPPPLPASPSSSVEQLFLPTAREPPLVPPPPPPAPRRMAAKVAKPPATATPAVAAQSAGERAEALDLVSALSLTTALDAGAQLSPGGSQASSAAAGCMHKESSEAECRHDVEEALDPDARWQKLQRRAGTDKPGRAEEIHCSAEPASAQRAALPTASSRKTESQPNPSKDSDAEEGEISDYEQPKYLPASFRGPSSSPAAPAGGNFGARQHREESETQQLEAPFLRAPAEASYPRSSAGGREERLGACGKNSFSVSSASAASPQSEASAAPDASVLDALIAARPLSSEAVLANLYSLKKSEAARPQPQTQRKPKRRTQEAEERHRQRWAEIRQRRAQAAAKRQHSKGIPVVGGNKEELLRPPPPPLVPCPPPF
ncbi:hypothetical protein cyc_07150 [Cyclospora cayetanensis]|uniref:Uncharacterized protein n=1 Tax=Cyclospora cayetanensis TaxID=88456 RepID=A0A1D3CTY6_9EIME|nr:hypothetical protein cyc_07150 [Cyclospora cayetanensis]